MVGRLSLLIAVFAIGVASASLLPGLSQSVRKTVGSVSGPGAAQLGADVAEQRRSGSESTEEKQRVKLTAAHIDVVAAQRGTVATRVTVPGTVMPHADRIARVAVKLSATVAELRKKLGDQVSKDEVIAVLESREVADAKSEYL